MNYKKLLTQIIISIISLLFICALMVYIIDPFFHFHKPWGGLKAILNEKEYQCVGTLKTFDYDAVIVGSSVCENYNNYWFDEKYEVTSIKAVRSYGATADLMYLLDVAYKHQNIKKVFYNIDLNSLVASTEVSFEATGCPMYLYDDNVFNDIQYLLNKDVILKKIPYMVIKSFTGDYNEGDSFNWGHWKEFNEDMVTGLYYRKATISPMEDADYFKNQCDANIKLLTKLVETHPETEFVFFIPPYSFVWWDSVYRDGYTESYLKNMRNTFEALIKYDNVSMYSFIDEENIVTNLGNYMDAIHFSPDINHFICDNLDNDAYKITSDNIDDKMTNITDYVYRAVNELILPYEDKIKVAY